MAWCGGGVHGCARCGADGLVVLVKQDDHVVVGGVGAVVMWGWYASCGVVVTCRSLRRAAKAEIVSQASY